MIVFEKFPERINQNILSFVLEIYRFYAWDKAIFLGSIEQLESFMLTRLDFIIF